MIVDPADVTRYTEAGWWGTHTISDLVREHARTKPDTAAYIEPDRRTTWARYDSEADRVAGALVGAGLSPGDRVAVLLPDSVHFHIALLGTERAGVVAVGIGARAGDAEIAHLVQRTNARALITLAEHRGRDAAEFPAVLAQRGAGIDWHMVLGEDEPRVHRVDADGRTADAAQFERPAPSAYAERALGPNDLWALNSTSGTTGMPKSVTQFQNRWLYFVELARRAGELSESDILFGGVPGPFGFGLWTAHFAPAVLGASTVVLPRFTTESMIDMIEQEQVTVLCCVSTQFRMLLNSPSAESSRLSSLRVMFTGGEAIPYERAVEFERRTGAVVLNFFGSNETGAFSYTTIHDSAEQRFCTGGSLIPEMDVRLFDDDFNDITASGGPGQPGGKGPLTCAGYDNDPGANAQLYTPDGYMLMGDLVTIGEDGYLRLVGRKSDLIIRGGKNISAAEVEAEVETHPAVELVSVVPVADELYGERVCAVVTTHPGAQLELEELTEHLLARGVSKELLPERLLVVPELPRSSGGKIAKAEVRRLVAERLKDEMGSGTR
ncbi:MAG: class I adenylate-forming enzyme family protein [Nocardiopsaceae bacterium]|nr:class I adenylate-forming enzyme family protein [Nocardiopsaceae bacterium]